MDEILSNIYFNPAHPAGFSNARALLKAARLQGLEDVSYKDVVRWLSLNSLNSIYAPAPPKVWNRPRIESMGPLHLWQGDTAIFGAKNDAPIRNMWPGWPAALCVVDVFSGWTAYRAMKDKSAESTAIAFRSIVMEDWSGRGPVFFSSDRGTEYMGNVFQSMLIEFGTAFYPAPQPSVKAAMAENKIRYLKRRLHLIAGELRARSKSRWPQERGNFPELLRQIGSAYNQRVQSKRLGPGISPDKVSYENAAEVAKYRYPTLPPVNIKTILPVGSSVRISTGRAVFQKGYGINWSTEIYKISRLLPRIPVMYKIQTEDGDEILGSYFREELKPV
jgi:hypothetical protein